MKNTNNPIRFDLNLELEVQGNHLSQKEVYEILIKMENLEENLMAMTKEEVATMKALNGWIYKDEKLTAHCSEGHWFSAKAKNFFKLPCQFCENPLLQDEAHFQEQLSEAFEEGRQQGIAEVEERIEYEGLMTWEDHHQAMYDDAMADQMREEPYTTDWDLS